MGTQLSRRASSERLGALDGVPARRSPGSYSMSLEVIIAHVPQRPGEQGPLAVTVKIVGSQGLNGSGVR